MREMVFLIEAEVGAGQLAQRCLEEAGFAVRTPSATAMIEEAYDDEPLLVLVDAALPGNGALNLCTCIRRNAMLAETRIVLFNSDAGEESRDAALRAGADDCLTKPFQPREFLARIRAVLYRLDSPLPYPLAEPADIVIDRAAMKLSVRGSEVVTTILEFRLVDYLAQHRGQVFTRDVILDAVWGETQFVTPRSVDACIRRVRGKIEPDRTRPTYLKTIRGVGYRFDAIAAWPAWTDKCTCPACAPSLGPSRTIQAGLLKKRKAAAQG